MKRHWIEHSEAWTPQPMSFWIHRETDGRNWYAAQAFDPPLPRPVGGSGLPDLLRGSGRVRLPFRFAGGVGRLRRDPLPKLLPTSRRLSEERGTGYGPNNHWLSRMPKGTKSWRYREKAVRVLAEARKQFAHETGQAG